MNQEDIQKARELYELARATYASEEQRYVDAENKIGRYLSILFVVLGLATANVDSFRNVVSERNWPSLVFGALTLASYLFGFFAFICFVLALRPQRIRSVGLDGAKLSNHFSEHSLADSQTILARGFFKSTQVVRGHTQTKLKLAERGLALVLVAVIFGGLAAGSYLFIERSEDNQMNIGNETPGPSSDSDEEDAPPPPSQDEDEGADLFTDVIKDGDHLFEDMTRKRR